MNKRNKEVFTKIAGAAALGLTAMGFSGCTSTNKEADVWTLLTNKCLAGEVTQVGETRVASYNTRLKIGDTLVLGNDWLGANKLVLLGSYLTDIGQERDPYPPNVLADGRIAFIVQTYGGLGSNNKVAVGLHWVDPNSADVQASLNCTDQTLVPPVVEK